MLEDLDPAETREWVEAIGGGEGISGGEGSAAGRGRCGGA